MDSAEELKKKIIELENKIESLENQAIIDQKYTSKLKGKYDEKTSIDIGYEIYYKQIQLEKGRKILDNLGEEKSKASMNYDKALAIKILEINDSTEVEFEGKKYKKPPAGSIPKVAAGMISETVGFEKDKKEIQYKIGFSKMESIKAELNGLQSIYKHLTEL